ncbi:unnamed protein product [Chrysoparadoxa australica]
MLRQLLFIYDYAHDAGRLRQISSLFGGTVTCCLFPAPGRAGAAQGEAEAEAEASAVWVLRVSRTIAVCLYQLEQSKSSEEEGGVLAMLQTLAEPKVWAQQAGAGGEAAARSCWNKAMEPVVGARKSIPVRSGAVGVIAKPLLFTTLRASWAAAAAAAAAGAGAGGGSAPPSAPLAKVLCRLSLCVMGVHENGWAGAAMLEAAFVKFSMAMLTLPCLLEHPLGGLLVKPLTDNAAWGWKKLVGGLYSEVSGSGGTGFLGSLSAAEVAGMVGNLLPPGRLSQLLWEDHMAADKSWLAQLICVVQQLLSRMPVHLLLAKSPSGAMAMEVESDDEAGRGAAGGDAMDNEGMGASFMDDEGRVHTLDVIAAREMKRCTVQLKSAVQSESEALLEEDLLSVEQAVLVLADQVLIGRLFDATLPLLTDGKDGKAREQPGKAEAAVEAAPMLGLASLYGDLLLLTHIKNDGVHSGLPFVKAILNSLAFGRPNQPVVARLWLYLKETHDLRSFASDQSVEEALPQLGSALFLLCSVYSYQLLALDDEEFYERQFPLKLPAVLELIDFLKCWLCRMYWTDPVIAKLLRGAGGSGSAAAATHNVRQVQIMLAATRLFNQLYERNTRRSLASEEFFYWPDISTAQLQPPDSSQLSAADVLDFFYGSSNLAMVLTNMPQVIPFVQRVAVFRQLMEAEKTQHQSADLWAQGSTKVRIRRDQLYEDSFTHLDPLHDRLRGRVQVTFINEQGLEEAGIDGGGVFKEFMDSLTKRAFDPAYELFKATSTQLLYPNPASGLLSEDHLQHFEFLGRVLGKAVFEGILVEPQFSPTFLNKLLGKHNYIDDLFSLDPEVYRSLMQVKKLAHDGGDVLALGLSFSLTTSAYGAQQTRDLIPGGSNVDVDASNLISYIHALANFKLNVEIAAQCRAFLRGFRDLIPLEWMRLFNSQELQRLIGGDGEHAIDVDDLRHNMRYAGGFHESQPIMQWFWEVISEFTPLEQGQFLKFVTSCSRQPLLGFQHLSPPLCIQKVPAGPRGDRLPSAATCMNLLKLPQYADKETLRQKLAYAIKAQPHGFELS